MTQDRYFAAAASLVLVGASFMAARSARRRFGHSFEPVTLLFVVWSAVLALFAIPFIRYSDTSAAVWVAVVGSLASFAAGCSMMYRGLQPADSSRPLEPLLLSRLRIAWIVFLALGLVGFGNYVRAIDEAIGWRALFSDLGSVRGLQSTDPTFWDNYGLWKLLTYFIQVSFVLWTIGIRAGAFRHGWRLVAPLGILSLVPFAFTADRTLFFTTVIWAGLLHLLWEPVRRKRVALLAGFVASACLLALFIFFGGRVDKTIESHPEVAAALETDHAGDLALPYVYTTASLPTLSQLMSDPIRPDTGGRMTLLPLVKIAHRLGLTGPPPEEVGAFYPIPFDTFNNYSWLGAFYLDFGLTGCVLLAAVFGTLCGLVMRWFSRNRSFLSLWVLSLLMYVIAFTPGWNKLSTTLTWQHILIGPLVSGFISVRRVHLSSMSTRLRSALASRNLRLATLGGITTCATLGVAAAYGSNSSPLRLSHPSSVASILRTVDAKARISFAARAPSSGYAFASQLHASEPELFFRRLTDSERLPSGVVAVSVAKDGYRLRARASDGSELTLERTFRPNGSSLRGPAQFITLRNGDFENPLADGWFVQSTAAAEILTAPSRRGGGRALFVRGTRDRARRATVVAQTVETLPNYQRRSRYELRALVLTEGLSRPLALEMRYTYRDGSYEFATIRLPRDSKTWRSVLVTAQAAKAIRSIQVFAFDLSPGDMDGHVYVDDVKLLLAR